MKAALLAIALATSSAALAQSGPERDARGIPVVSDPATPPAGANQPLPPASPDVRVIPAPNQAQVFAPRPADQEYPPCSATVTDNCVQTYERGSRRPS